jgi:hypothetical protein
MYDRDRCSSSVPRNPFCKIGKKPFILPGASIMNAANSIVIREMFYQKRPKNLAA